MPAGQLAGQLEGAEAPAARPDHVDDRVVELHERDVDLADDQVLVVARLGQDPDPVRPARQVVRHGRIAEAGDQKLVTIGRVVELRAAGRSAAVERVEVEAGGAVVRQASGSSC
jgi:hypothetical protein